MSICDVLQIVYLQTVFSINTPKYIHLEDIFLPLHMYQHKISGPIYGEILFIFKVVICFLQYFYIVSEESNKLIETGYTAIFTLKTQQLH